ncbi:Serine/threonine-protein kinase PrkC [Botrimarina hoheduenensis]|uniref:Serine/threonine-protein kinase PrkC n=1 Tax=Botrimarina hoheduenensis TaxID=2528000 RepID=A0A5C5WDY7_9BACT|nr:Serine/threonine-protein kinase PrkC [Botrimarina hoheduenensis]
MSVWIDTFDQSYEYEGAAALKKAVKAAPEGLRSVLISQLLPQLIDHDRKRQGRTPTLHELRSRFPDLAEVLSDAYPLLAAGYRLPVELRGYRVLRVVGEGGQAIVLRAQDDMHSAVAIKLSASPEHNELLLRERELLGQCQHPGIPDVIASGVDEDRAYFVMPFLRGMTLADKYATHRPTAEEAVRVATELCGVVDHLHGRSILHRDIKPQNVWLDDSGAVKLIDLGMAIDRSSWGSSRAQVGEFHGTPAFMSPEQAAADGENDGELSDVFSIGAVLYWMGTGATLYESVDRQSLLSHAAQGRFDRDQLSAVTAWPKPLTRACLKAMSIKPAERYRSAVELGDRLVAVGVVRKPPARLRAAALLLVLLGVVAAVVVFGPPGHVWRPPSSASAGPELAPTPSGQEEPAVKPPGEHHADGGERALGGGLPPGHDGMAFKADLPRPPEGMEYAPVAVGPYNPDGPPTIDRALRKKSLLPQPASPPVLGPNLSQEERVGRAKAWLGSLSPSSPMGDFVGLYFKPTGFQPICSVVKEINIRAGHGGEIRTFSFGDASEMTVDPLWDPKVNTLRHALLKPPPYKYDFAFHTAYGPAVRKRKGYLLIPPGWQGLFVSVRLLDGWSSKSFFVPNVDPCLINHLTPFPGQKQNVPAGWLYLYQDPSRPGRASNLFSFVDEPERASEELRNVLIRTYAGFYAEPPPQAQWTLLSTQPDSLVLPDSVEPGPLFVHFVSAEKRTIRRVAYQVPREKFEGLAADVVAGFEGRQE